MFIDWLQYTIKDVFTQQDDIRLVLSRVCASLPAPIKDLIGFCSPEWDRVGYTITKGVNFYGSAVVFENGLKICYDPYHPRMGTNIIISGSVLKQRPVAPDDVLHWLTKILPKFDFKISRVDIAQDTNVDFSYFFEKYSKGDYVTRYRRSSQKSFLDADNRGTLYFGSRGKGTFIRIYDKYQEQLSKIKSDLAAVEFKQQYGGEPWTRLEMECRDTQAAQMLDCFVKGECGNVFLGHLRFVEKYNDHVERCKTDSVYMKVINAVEGRRLSKDLNSELNLDWIINVAMANLQALRKVHPKLYDLLLDRVESSAPALSKTRRAKMDLDRLYFSLKKDVDIDNDGLIDPLIIDKVLKFRECEVV